MIEFFGCLLYVVVGVTLAFWLCYGSGDDSPLAFVGFVTTVFAWPLVLAGAALMAAVALPIAATFYGLDRWHLARLRRKLPADVRLPK